MNFTEALHTRRLFFDGAMGTMLQEAGLQPGELPETWNLLHPEKVRAIHQAYVRAGVDILKTNTFGANGLKFGAAHGQPEVEELVRAGVENARAAFAAEVRDGFVALDLGPTGKLLQPFGDLPFAEAVALYAAQVKAGAAAGADLILIETMSDSYEAKAAILAAKENADLPIVCTFTFDEDGKLLNGADVTTALVMAESLGVSAVGFNCGQGPDTLVKLVPQALQAVDIPLVANPNAGLPVQKDGKTVFHIDGEGYAPLMVPFAEAGDSVLGGCCGTTPDHIARLIEACRDIPLPAPRSGAPCAIAGYGRAVDFEGMPVIIGERINPTGKPRLKEALKSQNMDYVCQLALEQLDKGAQVLDVNVGVPGVDEPALIEMVILTLQSITSVQLQIATSNIEAMDRALRIYTGRTLFGAMPPKGQEMDDHYFGTIRQRIASFMKEVNIELWKMGVTAKTQHNEVAPAQHELASIYSEANVAVDNNQLVMQTLKRIACQHGLKCLLHEKPFAGVNGSGKHNNWSITTDDGINLLEPGKTPHENIQFLLVLSCVLKAVDVHADLLRESAADPGNDH